MFLQGVFFFFVRRLIHNGSLVLQSREQLQQQGPAFHSSVQSL